MKTRLISLMLLGATAGFGQYVYDSTDGWYNSTIGSRWSQNGSPTFTPYPGFQGTGGSLIDVPAISGSNPNDYEVKSTLGLKAGGGTYIQFLRAGSNAVQAGSGSYVSVEIVMPAVFSSTGIATLKINQCVSGTVTQFASASITATKG